MHFMALPCFGRSVTFPGEAGLGRRGDTQAAGWVKRLVRARAQLGGKLLFSPGDRSQKLSAQKQGRRRFCRFLFRVSGRGETKLS